MVLVIIVGEGHDSESEVEADGIGCDREVEVFDWSREEMGCEFAGVV